MSHCGAVGYGWSVFSALISPSSPSAVQVHYFVSVLPQREVGMTLD